jgi:hypothetical protein
MYYLGGRRVWSAVGVLVGVEQVGQLLLDRGCVGEHALGSGAAFGAVTLKSTPSYASRR